MTNVSSGVRWRRFVSVFLLAILGLAVPAVAQTPSLAEIAKKEQERRKGLKTPPKVIKDLPKSTAPAQPAGAPAETAAPAAAADQKPAEPEKDETWWRTRIGQVREALRRDEVFLEALQSRVNALSTDFVNRDDPFQRAKIAEDRQKALSEMERVKGEIDQLKKQIDDIEEEARKAGVPPGWLR